jgi:hypothetical protein
MENHRSTRQLQEALNDWGWYGPADLRPSWYTGQPYNAAALRG